MVRCSHQVRCDLRTRRAKRRGTPLRPSGGPSRVSWGRAGVIPIVSTCLRTRSGRSPTGLPCWQQLASSVLDRLFPRPARYWKQASGRLWPGRPPKPRRGRPQNVCAAPKIRARNVPWRHRPMARRHEVRHRRRKLFVVARPACGHRSRKVAGPGLDRDPASRAQCAHGAVSEAGGRSVSCDRQVG